MRRGSSRKTPIALLGLAATLSLSGCSFWVAPADPELATLRLELAQCVNGNQHRATAVAIGNNIVASVAHAFDNIESFELSDSVGNVYQAELIYLDNDKDISLISLSSDAPASLRLSDPPEDPGDVAITFVTFADEDGPITKRAEVLRWVRVSLDGVGDRAGLELAADISAGDSGGPIIDSDGGLIGLVFASSKVGERGWGVAAAEISSALQASQDSGSEAEPVALNC